MRRIAALLALSGLLPVGGHAQISPWPSGGGMGGANLVLARGFRALEWNPANLALPGGPAWSFAPLRVGGGAMVSGADPGRLVDILRAGGTGEASLLEGIPAGGLEVEVAADAFPVSLLSGAADLPDPGGGTTLPSLALSVGRVGLSVRNEMRLTASLSRELADLTVLGFDPERIREYAVGNTGFRSYSVTTLTVGAAAPLGSAGALGIAVRGVRGNRLVQGRLFEPEIDLDAQALSVNGVAVAAPSGRGFGIDVGAVFRPLPSLTLGLAVRNAVQRLTWDDALVVYAADISDDDFDTRDAEEILDRFQGEELDPRGASLRTYEAARGLFREAFFPRIFLLGAGVSSSRGGSVQVTYSATQGPGRLAGPWDDRISVGLEQDLPLLTLRAGYAAAADGLRAATAGLGLHLGVVRLDAMVGRITGTGGGGGATEGLMGALALSLEGGR